jgi:hypothetical protein
MMSSGREIIGLATGLIVLKRFKMTEPSSSALSKDHQFGECEQTGFGQMHTSPIVDRSGDSRFTSDNVIGK